MNTLGLGITTEAVQNALVKTGPILVKVDSYLNKGAKVAPKALPYLRKLIQLLAIAPRLTPVVQVISSDAAKIFKDAPQYTKIVNEVIDLIIKLPELASELAGPLHTLATLVTNASKDPALPIVIARINTIIELYKDSGPSATTATPSAPKPPFQLSKIVPVLNLFITIKKHPWLLWATPTSIALVCIGTGFLIGRVTKR